MTYAWLQVHCNKITYFSSCLWRAQQLCDWGQKRLQAAWGWCWGYSAQFRALAGVAVPAQPQSRPAIVPRMAGWALLSRVARSSTTMVEGAQRSSQGPYIKNVAAPCLHRKGVDGWLSPRWGLLSQQSLEACSFHQEEDGSVCPCRSAPTRIGLVPWWQTMGWELPLGKYQVLSLHLMSTRRSGTWRPWWETPCCRELHLLTCCARRLARAQSWDFMEVAKAHLALILFLLLVFHVGICNIARETWREYQQQLSHPPCLQKRPKCHSGCYRPHFNLWGNHCVEILGPWKQRLGMNGVTKGKSCLINVAVF